MLQKNDVDKAIGRPKKGGLLLLQLGILLLTAALIGVDQVTKWLVVSFLKGHDPLVIIPGILSFTYTENTGAAWNLFDGQNWLLIGVTSVVLLGVLAILLCGRFRVYRTANIGGILVIAGGTGNLIDRLTRGFVVDFIKADFISFPIFNIADCCVVIGAILLFVYFVFFYSDHSEKKKVAEEPRDIITKGKEEISFDHPSADRENEKQ